MMEPREFIVGTRRQQEWGWLVIFDLFLSGIGAGLFAVALIPGMIAAMALGGCLVLAGGLVLLADLSRRQAAWRVFARPQKSWVSRGAFGLLGFSLLAAAYSALLFVYSDGGALTGTPWTAGPAGLMVFAVVVGVVALFVAGYTGLLLGSMRAIPLWNSAYTPALFLVSSLLGGLGAVFVFPLNSTAYGWTLPLLQNLGLGLVVVELFLLAALIWLSHPKTTRESVRLLTHGSLRYHFTVGLLGVGLLAPLIMLTLVRIGIGSTVLLPLAGAFLIIGVFVSRYTIARAGIYISPV